MALITSYGVANLVQTKHSWGSRIKEFDFVSLVQFDPVFTFKSNTAVSYMSQF